MYNTMLNEQEIKSIPIIYQRQKLNLLMVYIKLNKSHYRVLKKLQTVTEVLRTVRTFFDHST